MVIKRLDEGGSKLTQELTIRMSILIQLLKLPSKKTAKKRPLLINTEFEDCQAAVISSSFTKVAE
jgi:hypothetical protein